jgi:hypothetical protein
MLILPPYLPKHVAAQTRKPLQAAAHILVVLRLG